MWHLDMVPVYLSDRPRLLAELTTGLEQVFPVAVRIRTPWFDPEVSFEPARGQYSSTNVLRCLLDQPPRESSRILGVVGVDLFAPVLTYVFGEAQLDGRAAVVSIHRLRPEAYGLPADDGLLRARLLKESVHELGHTFGLLHCQVGTCVMHPSTYVEDIDLKSADFCADCRSRIPAALPI
jgi:archaemetzincin